MSDLGSPTPYARTSLDRFRRGIVLGMPIFLGYLPVGMAFGIIATAIGFTATQAIVCSASALAGAGQFIAISMIEAEAEVLAVIAATTVVNLRYVLFGATLAPCLTHTPLRLQAALAFSLTDETFAVNINDHRQGTSSAASMAGVGAIAWTGWVAGTAIGALASAWIGDPSAWGVDFAMAAMFVALLVALANGRRLMAVAALAAVLVIAIPKLEPLGVSLSASWTMVIAAIIAATAGAVARK